MKETLLTTVSQHTDGAWSAVAAQKISDKWMNFVEPHSFWLRDNYRGRARHMSREGNRRPPPCSPASPSSYSEPIPLSIHHRLWKGQVKLFHENINSYLQHAQYLKEPVS